VYKLRKGRSRPVSGCRPEELDEIMPRGLAAEGSGAGCFVPGQYLSR